MRMFLDPFGFYKKWPEDQCSEQQQQSREDVDKYLQSNLQVYAEDIKRSYNDNSESPSTKFDIIGPT